MSISNAEKSLKKTVKMYGVEIKKMPCGKYFEALQTLKNLPEDFIKELSDNEQELKLSEMFKMENIMKLITRLLIILPDFSFTFLSKIMDIDKDILENELAPIEVLELTKKFWEINKLESFFEQMKPIINKITTLIGFKEQLQPVSK
jgi:hypothetical protein